MVFGVQLQYQIFIQMVGGGMVTDLDQTNYIVCIDDDNNYYLNYTTLRKHTLDYERQRDRFLFEFDQEINTSKHKANQFRQCKTLKEKLEYIIKYCPNRTIAKKNSWAKFKDSCFFGCYETEMIKNTTELAEAIRKLENGTSYPEYYNIIHIHT